MSDVPTVPALDRCEAAHCRHKRLPTLPYCAICLSLLPTEEKLRIAIVQQRGRQAQDDPTRAHYRRLFKKFRTEARRRIAKRHAAAGTN